MNFHRQWRQIIVLKNWAYILSALGFLLGNIGFGVADAAPAHSRPFLMPKAAKERILERIRSNAEAQHQYQEIKMRADSGKPGDAAIVYSLEGGDRYAQAVCKNLLEIVRYRTPRLDDDISAGGHREGNMDFYWDTAEVRWYDLVYSALSDIERTEIERFYKKLGRYWKDSLSRWTTTPNLVFPIHYHAAVIGFCMDDAELIAWGLRDPGGKFGPSRGGLFPVLDEMLRDGTIWDEATIYAAFNVLQPMMQLSILHQCYFGQDLFGFKSPKGGSIKNLLDGYIALTYPIERTGVGPGSFHVATYGDGSTESPHIGHHNADSLYLVNLPWAKNNERAEMSSILEQAYYVSGDSRYAYFLSHCVERSPSFLYGSPILPASVKAPVAPSSVFPEAGIAMLRADESPAYWTNGSLAVLQVMGRGYGHDHRDKMSIILHANGRLFYPDFNCVQYEPPGINWTGHSIAHNTLIVDRTSTANAEHTIRHDFKSEIKFLATTANCYPGVDQTRVLALTREYLLDLFWADSEIPHTYDWALHAIGRLSLETPTLYSESADLKKDYWWIENEKSRRTGLLWRADFLQTNGLAIRGMGRHTDDWFAHGTGIRVTMIDEPETAVYGADGPTGGPPADTVSNPEGNLPLLLARRIARQTVFAAVHEPHKQQGPEISEVLKFSETRHAYAVEVRTKNYRDHLAVAFGNQKDLPVHKLRGIQDPAEALIFRNYGYLREVAGSDASQTCLTGRGDWIGFKLRCPNLPSAGGLIINGQKVFYTKVGDYIEYGEIAMPAAEKLYIATKIKAPEWAVPGQKIGLEWIVHNAGNMPVSNVQMRLNMPFGFEGAGEIEKVNHIQPGNQWAARFLVQVPSIGQQSTRKIAISPTVNCDRNNALISTVGDEQELMLTQPLELDPPTEPVRLSVKGSRTTVFKLRSWSFLTQSVYMHASVPTGITAELQFKGVAIPIVETENSKYVWHLPDIVPGQILELSMRLSTIGDVKPGLHYVLIRTAKDIDHSWSPAIPMRITIGPVLLEDNSFPTFGEYVIHAPQYTFRLSKRYGTSRYLHDDADRPRYEATYWNRRPTAMIEPDALPRLRVNDQDVVAWGHPVGYLWPTTSPASVIVSSGQSRIAWNFEDDAIRIEPVALWASEAPHEFVFPGDRSGWISWGEKPRWLKIVAVDSNGVVQKLSKAPSKDQELRINAAALQTSGFQEVICFAVGRPQKARFDGSNLRLAVNPGESIWFGLSAPEHFEAWYSRRAKK